MINHAFGDGTIHEYGLRFFHVLLLEMLAEGNFLGAIHHLDP